MTTPTTPTTPTSPDTPEPPASPEDSSQRRGRVRLQRRLTLAAVLGALACGILLWVYWDPVWDFTMQVWHLVKDKEAFRQKIESYGVWAPLAFIAFQIAQVLFSPIPGELVGAAGGYVFGWLPSLVYSTIGLSVGSWINFFLARALGQRLVEKIIPPSYLARIAYLMERQGVIASFIFFVIPGFPKDYFCYALGLSPMSWRIFLVVSTAGRIPGTLMLSIQGAMVYQENYWTFILLGIISIAFVAPVYIWRERLYQMLYRLEKGRGPINGQKDAEKDAE